MTTRAEAIQHCGELSADHEIAMAAMTPREQAEGAYTPTPCHEHGVVHTVDELEDLIRADRGMPPIHTRSTA